MTKSGSTIKRIFVYSTCALAFSAIGGVANAHMCLKKPHTKGYVTSMHPQQMQSYAVPAKPYRYPAHGYRAPMHREGLNKDTGKYRKQKDGAASNTASLRTHYPDIIETATAAGNFNTLIKAVVAADLYDTLRGEGPFTLFAPTDDAFAKLPDELLDTLWTDKDMLVAVLSYHVVPGRLTAADLLQRREFKTVQGQTLSISELDVVRADNETANGIVHVVENVVVPDL